MAFSFTPQCSCWQARNYVSGRSLPKSCPPMRPRTSLSSFRTFCAPEKVMLTSKHFSAPRVRSSGVHSEHRTPSRGSAHSGKEYLVISPGYCMTRSKEQISVTLDQEFFESCSVEAPTPPCPTRVKEHSMMQDIVEDLQEQISKLIALLEQERNDHQKTKKHMTTAYNEKIEELQEKSKEEVSKLKGDHAAELNALESQWKMTLEEEKRKLGQQLAELQKDSEHLQSSFRTYKESLSEEMNDRWQKMEARWRETLEEEKEKALMHQKETLMNAAEKEKNEAWQRAQKEICAVQQKHTNEMEDLQRKYSDVLQKSQLQERLKEDMHLELVKKQEVMEMLNSCAQEGQPDLERLKKDLLDAQRACEERVNRVDAKYKQAMQSLMHENTDLRRRLTTKTEELYHEKSRQKLTSPKSLISSLI